MFKISFDFNETTKKISNIQVVSEKKVIDLNIPTLLVMSNKLQLSDSAIAMLNATSGKRIAINYWQVSNEETFPVIGLSEVFSDADGGNVLSKSNTISYRGKQRETLLMYGDYFKLEEFKQGMFKLTPIKETEDTLEEEMQDLEDLNNISGDEMEDLPF